MSAVADPAALFLSPTDSFRRIRDKTLGGGPFSDPRAQGFVSGLGYLPRSDKGLAQGTVEEQWRELGHQTDVLKLCMAGTVRAARARRCGGGGEIRGDEFRFPDGTLVAFAEEPAEVSGASDAWSEGWAGCCLACGRMNDAGIECLQSRLCCALLDAGAAAPMHGQGETR